MQEREVLRHLKLTAELYGKTLSDAAATMFVTDLARFTPEQICSALAKCRNELRTFPTIADISSRVEDGRPGPEEAWVMIPKDEEASVVWTEEMASAFGVARPMVLEGDLVAARMAFREVYSRLLAEARAKRTPVRWTPSLGYEKAGRQAALEDAVTKGRLSLPWVQQNYPELEHQPVSERTRAIVSSATKALE